MKVGELKKLLEDADENLMVYIPQSTTFDGRFYSPSVNESGVTKMGTADIEEDDIKEMELLAKPIPEEDVFLLVPKDFGDEKELKHELN